MGEIVDFVEQLQELKIFAAEHFSNVHHPSELGPEIHNFRHRAELFFLASGYLDRNSIEEMGLAMWMPERILQVLENAKMYVDLQQM